MIYKKNITNSKIVQIIIIASVILVVSVLASKSYDLYQVHNMHQVTKTIYNHPLRVSTLSLKVESLLYKIHRNMKDIVLKPSKEEFESLIFKVDNLEKDVYNALDVIKEYILGEEGKELVKQTRLAFLNWKPIRDEVVFLVNSGNNEIAIDITKNKGAKHVLLLEKHVNNLNSYAQDKATFFKNKSIEIFTQFELFNFAITSVFLFTFLFMSYYIIRKLSSYISILEDNKTLLETVIRESPNPIMLHNEDGEVLMINKVWEDLTGYKYSEIDTTEKWTSLAYDSTNVNNVKNDIDNLYKIEHRVDEGEYEIKRKDGQTITWTFTSAPLGFINRKRTVISSAMDVTDLKNKDNLLYVQSRHAAMGEMIANISHQWRQPLSLISTIATGLELKEQSFGVDKKEFIKSMININSTVQYLSKTIDDFRNFFNPNKSISSFNIKEVFEKTFSLVSSQFKNKNIVIVKDIENLEVEGHENELLQVIINILNNARDILSDSKLEKKYIFVNVYKENTDLCISIKDNGGGIKEEIIDKIFEPYFTTKHQSQGTGIGLYMTEEIICKHMNGKIEASNESFTFEGLEYIGAKFVLILPIKE